MEKVTLYEEYRLIERSESEVNGAWKGAHLLLFFLAFVFGSFCTFCFHMLMYLFDEKCVLFPKLLSLTSLRHNVIYEFIPEDKEKSDMLPVDFLSTQWMEKSACYLPTYVPLISAIFGLVWTTMFLMCSTGSRTLTGLQRPWRVIQPVFVFSLAMGSLCIYTSIMTQYGLKELCIKLGEITGSSTCSYTVNVATLAYERQIRGVYQATRLTILSAWLHTACWLLSALLALVRVCLAVDFQLVRISVDLVGNIERMLEHQEEQIRMVSPNTLSNADSGTTNRVSSETSLKVHFGGTYDVNALKNEKTHMIYVSENSMETSELSLVPEERNRIARREAYHSVPKEMQFVVKIVYDLVDNIELPESEGTSTTSLPEDESSIVMIARQFGRENISKTSSIPPDQESVGEGMTSSPKHELHEILKKRDPTTPSTSHKHDDESKWNLTTEMKQTMEDNLNKSTDDVGAAKEQNDSRRKTKKDRKVQISVSVESVFTDEGDEGNDDNPSGRNTKNKVTQTKPKEKQE